MTYMANITIYMNRTCTGCGTKGATVYGLCLVCTHKKQNKDKVDPRALVGQWVKRGVTHHVEHYVSELYQGNLIFACGKAVSVGDVAPGSGVQSGVYQCGACSDAVGVKHEEFT